LNPSLVQLTIPHPPDFKQLGARNMAEKEKDVESSINPTQPNFVKILELPED
jgi:hypothetical protein